jgi:hypothetical protein
MEQLSPAIAVAGADSIAGLPKVMPSSQSTSATATLADTLPDSPAATEIEPVSHSSSSSSGLHPELMPSSQLKSSTALLVSPAAAETEEDPKAAPPVSPSSPSSLPSKEMPSPLLKSPTAVLADARLVSTEIAPVSQSSSSSSVLLHPSKYSYVLRTIGRGVFIAGSTLSEEFIDAGDGVFASPKSPGIDVGDFVIGYTGVLLNEKKFRKLQARGTVNRFAWRCQATEI